MTTTDPVIVCRDCGWEVFRKAAYLLCSCRCGFVAQWDTALGEGRFLGRILEPIYDNALPLEVAR